MKSEKRGNARNRRPPAYVTLLFWRCRITRLLILTALGVRRGKMIHRRDTIAQRTTRVEFRDKGESVPRRAYADGIFRLPWNLYILKVSRSSFSDAKIGAQGCTSRPLRSLPVSRDDKQKWETCCACTYLRVLKSEDLIIILFFFYNKLLSLLGVKTETRSSRSIASS